MIFFNFNILKLELLVTSKTAQQYSRLIMANSETTPAVPPKRHARILCAAPNCNNFQGMEEKGFFRFPKKDLER